MYLRGREIRIVYKLQMDFVVVVILDIVWEPPNLLEIKNHKLISFLPLEPKLVVVEPWYDARYTY